MAIKITDECINCGACEAECPKEISVSNIEIMNKEYIKANT